MKGPAKILLLAFAFSLFYPSTCLCGDHQGMSCHAQQQTPKAACHSTGHEAERQADQKDDCCGSCLVKLPALTERYGIFEPLAPQPIHTAGTLPNTLQGIDRSFQVHESDQIPLPSYTCMAILSCNPPHAPPVS